MRLWPPLLRAVLLLAPPLLVGALLRLWRLHRQVFVGDEMHGVMSALELSLPGILTNYRLADHSIPLSALYHLLLASGVKLSEVVIRLPSLLAGLALLVLAPAAVLRWSAAADRWRWAAVLAWLLAISPSLVYYSRFARPYAVVALLCPLAAVAFWRWWRGAPHAGHGWAVLYVVAGAAAGWFFLGALPFVAAPLAWGAGDLVVGRLRGRAGEAKRGLLGLTAVAAGLAAGVAGFLLPALKSLGRILRHKATQAEATPRTLEGVGLIQAGTEHPVVALLFWGLAAAGLALLLRRRPALGGYAALLVGAQWVAIAFVLRPYGMGHPVIFSRYVLVTLPVVLLWVAGGIGWIAERIERRGSMGRWAGAGMVAAFVAAFGLAGPYAAEPGFRLGPFGGAWQGLELDRRHTGLPAALIPAAYHQIAAEPGDGAVVHVVRGLASITLVSEISFARFHGRPVILAIDHSWLEDPRLAFRTVQPIDAARLRRSGGRFVVLVQDRPYYRRLEAAVERGRPPPRPTDRRHPSRVWARAMARELGRAWGEPHLVSEGVLVWDLARLPEPSSGPVTVRSPGP